MRPGESARRREIVAVCRRLYAHGLIAGPDGNVSSRLGKALVVTPSGRSKGELRPSHLVVVGLEGRKLRGRLEPSSELLMHLHIYRSRPDVQAIVHAHPPAATALTVARRPFVSAVLPEVILQMGKVPVLSYARPGSVALASSVAQHLLQHEAVLLANHGVTTVGANLREAHQRMESLEHAARIMLMAHLLGGVHSLRSSEVRALLRRAMGAASAPPTGRKRKGLRRSIARHSERA